MNPTTSVDNATASRIRSEWDKIHTALKDFAGSEIDDPLGLGQGQDRRRVQDGLARDGHRHAAVLGQRQEQADDLGRIVPQDDDDLAGLHALPIEPASEVSRRVDQFLVGERPPLMDERERAGRIREPFK